MKTLIQKQQERFDEQFIREDGLLDIGKYDEDKIKSLMLQNTREIVEHYKEIIRKVEFEITCDENVQETVNAIIDEVIKALLFKLNNDLLTLK